MQSIPVTIVAAVIRKMEMMLYVTVALFDDGMFVNPHVLTHVGFPPMFSGKGKEIFCSASGRHGRTPGSAGANMTR